MIRKLTIKDQFKVLEYLYKEAALNIFIIGDIENYGFDVEFQEVYGEFVDDKYQSVLLRYKENIIYYSHETSFNTKWLPIIHSMNYEFISGRKTLTDLLLKHLPNMVEKPMYFCEVTDFNPELIVEDEGIIDAKTEEDCRLNFEILKSIEEFTSMQKQEEDDFVSSRMLALKTSKMYYIKENNKAVSTVTTVADTTKSAMVIGVATLPEYRGKGYASKLIIKLLHEYLVNRQKSLCLFYDNPKAGAIYHRLGFKDIDMWVMLLRKEG